MALRKQVNLVMGDQLDIYTRNRLKSVLQDNQVSYTTGKGGNRWRNQYLSWSAWTRFTSRAKLVQRFNRPL